MPKQVRAIEKGTINHAFSLTVPGALNVTLVGDFTHWGQNPISLHKEAGGIWRTTVPLEPGEHHYRFLVDGEWRDDPEFAVRVPGPPGNQNALVKVADRTSRH